MIALVLNVLLVITSALLIVLILLHRGKGGGLSSMFGGAASSSLSGSAVVEKNLNRPLREIQDEIFNSQLRKVDIRVAVRTGDTPQRDRAAMLRDHPDILITTRSPCTSC